MSGSQIYLTSTADVKRRALQLILPYSTILYAKSDAVLPEQPVSTEQGIACAKRRIPRFEEAEFICISIENFLRVVDGKWVDSVCVICMYQKNEIRCYVGGDAEIDQELFGQYQTDVPSYEKTYGQWLKDNGHCTNAADWQPEGRLKQLTHCLRHLYYEKNQITAETLPAYIDYYADYPKVGVLFKDISPLYQHDKLPQFLDLCLNSILGSAPQITDVFGIESRGFQLGSLIAFKLGASFHMIRKSGKLPFASKKVSYQTEYSTAEIEIGNYNLKGKHLLIVDDLIATGGSIAAAAQLLPEELDKYCFTPVFVEELVGCAQEQLAAAWVKWIKLK